LRAKLREIAEQSGSDPKAALWDSLGDTIKSVNPKPYELLVATYIRPEKTKGGIFVPDRTLTEDRFQGKVGLVLKLGEFCFEDDAKAKWGSFRPAVGDWVIFRASDGWEVFVGDGREGTACRFVHEGNIVGLIDDPDFIF
jgi:co-chaperonin GroES (HSP10)